MRFHTAFAALAALLVLPSVSSAAFADDNPQNAQFAARTSRDTGRPTTPTIASDETSGATPYMPAENNTARKVTIEVEPIQQPAATDTSPDEPNGVPPATATEQIAPDMEQPSATSDASSNVETPVTASRICRKFSAAIAMVIEVPCERRAF